MNIAVLIPEICWLLEQTGLEIMRIAEQDDIGVVRKSDNSPYTHADLRAHDVLSQGLQTLTSDLPILSEEGEHPSFEQRKHWSSYWLLDPLDATRAFIKDHGRDWAEKKGEFTINLALIRNNVAILGFIYQPLQKQGFLGGQEYGTFTWRAGCLAQKEAVKATQVNSGERLILSRHSLTPEVEALLDNLNLYNYIQMSGAFKFCAIANGSADFYLRFDSISEWDIAAGQAIIEGVGGCVQDFSGKPLRYNLANDFMSPSFIATCLPNHSLVSALLTYQQFIEQA